MGFSNDGGGRSGAWANFKDGKIITKIDGKRVEFSHLEGDLVDIIQTTEVYQGAEYEKITLCIVHEDGLTKIGFPLRSGYCRGLCKMAPNIDYGEPIKISSTVNEDEKTKAKYGSLFISQNGKAIKHFYKTGETGKNKIFPKVEVLPVKKGSKETYKDYEKIDKFCEGVLAWMLKKIQEHFPEGAKNYKVSEPDETMSVVIDDLPF